jgi:hypothetical protein
MFSFVNKLTLVIFITLFCSLSLCLAQSDAKGNYTNVGKVISKGRNTSPSGTLSVVSYRLEIIKLTSPIDLNDGKPPLETAFRLIITTQNPLPVGSFKIHLGNMELPASLLKPNEVATIIFRRNLPANVTLSLSKQGENESLTRSSLAEMFSVPSRYAASFEEMQKNSPVVRLYKVNKSSDIEIKINIPGRKCYEGNNLLVIEVGAVEFGAGCDEDAIVRQLSAEEFSRMNNGAEIAVKDGYGNGARNRLVVGQLNKNTVE